MRDVYLACIICKAAINFSLDPYSQDGGKQFYLQIVYFKVYDLKNLLETAMQILSTVSEAQSLHSAFLIVFVSLSILLYRFPAAEILKKDPQDSKFNWLWERVGKSIWRRVGIVVFFC